MKNMRMECSKFEGYTNSSVVAVKKRSCFSLVGFARTQIFVLRVLGLNLMKVFYGTWWGADPLIHSMVYKVMVRS